MSPTIALVTEANTVYPLSAREETVGGGQFQTAVGRDPVALWRLGETGFPTDIIGGHHGRFVRTSGAVGVPELAASLVPGDPNPSTLLGAGVTIEVLYGSWADHEEFSFGGVFEVTEESEYPSAVVVRADQLKFCWGVLLDEDQLQFVTGSYAETMTLASGIYHFMVAGDADTIALYLDGVEVASLPFGPEQNFGAGFCFGAPLPAFSFDAYPGRLDEFVYYDTRLPLADIQADYLYWSLGQDGSVDLLHEVETVRPLTPRYGTGQTYRRVMVDHGAWAYWTPLDFASSGVVYDYGEQDHDAVRTATGAPWDPLIGPTQTGAESPQLLSNQGILESDDTFSSGECTLSCWIGVSPVGNVGVTPYSGPITVEIPLVGMATAEGSSTFDKCLYLDTSGHLCWMTNDGSPEVITDSDPLPQNNVACHVVVSVGPAGTKIRVDGQTKATGANTTSLTTPQKVFYFTGGTGGGHDFTTNGSEQRHAYLQATVFDEQLSDAQTDEHRLVGRSIRSIEYFWGIDSSGEAISFSDHSLNFSGQTERYTDPGILANDPLLGAMTVTGQVTQRVSGATWGTSSGARGSTEIRHVYWEPNSLSGTQAIFGLMEYTTQFVTTPSITAVRYYWRLVSIGGDLTWIGYSISNISTEVDRFTHTVPLVDGQVNAVGMEINGATVDLWVNGVKEPFTRSEASTWTVVTGANLLATYQFAGTFTPSLLPGTEIEVMTGRVAELIYNGGTGASQGGGATYNKPPLFFEDLASHVSNQQISVEMVAELETVYELEVSPDPTAQAITIDMVNETDVATGLGQIGPSIQTLVETSQVHELVQPTPVTMQGVGVVTIDDELEFLGAELRLRILDSTVVRAPTSLTVTLSGGVAEVDVVFDIDGTDVLTVSLDSDGSLGPTSINLTSVLGTVGDHVLTVTQTTVDGVTSGSGTFTVLLEPPLYPEAPVADGPSVAVPGAVDEFFVRHWVFQDLLPEVDGGIGSYVLPHNPRNMNSPQYEHALTSRHSTAQDGKIHVFQGADIPKEWQFSGYCSSQAQQTKLLQYRYLNRRFYIIDHRNRAWKVVVLNAEFVPRLRQNYDGIPTDWGSDYTMTVVVLDQNFSTPEA